MVRASVIVLVVLALFGLVVAVLPERHAPPLGKVELSGVNLVLYPAADPDARWTFKAERVSYDPDRRESVVIHPEDGKRFVKSRLDLTLRADEIKIDANDNLETQTATIFVPKNCITATLGKPGLVPVRVDQNIGYLAPYARVKQPDTVLTGGPLTASFDLETRFELSGAEFQYIDHQDGLVEACRNGRIVLVKQGQETP